MRAQVRAAVGAAARPWSPHSRALPRQPRPRRQRRARLARAAGRAAARRGARRRLVERRAGRERRRAARERRALGQRLDPAARRTSTASRWRSMFAEEVHTLEFPSPWLKQSPDRLRALACAGRRARRAESFESYEESFARELAHFHDCVVERDRVPHPAGAGPSGHRRADADVPRAPRRDAAPRSSAPASSRACTPPRCATSAARSSPCAAGRRAAPSARGGDRRRRVRRPRASCSRRRVDVSTSARRTRPRGADALGTRARRARRLREAARRRARRRARACSQALEASGSWAAVLPRARLPARRAHARRRRGRRAGRGARRARPLRLRRRALRQPTGWRLDPASSGPTYVTATSARTGSISPSTSPARGSPKCSPISARSSGGPLEDHAALLLRFDSGATG